MYHIFQQTSQRIPSRLRQARRPTYVACGLRGWGSSPCRTSTSSSEAGSHFLHEQSSPSGWRRPAKKFTTKPCCARSRSVQRARLMRPRHFSHPLIDVSFECHRQFLEDVHRTIIALVPGIFSNSKWSFVCDQVVMTPSDFLRWPENPVEI